MGRDSLKHQRVHYVDQIKVNKSRTDYRVLLCVYNAILGADVKPAWCYSYLESKLDNAYYERKTVNAKNWRLWYYS